jgi:protein disulfide-isomerase A6
LQFYAPWCGHCQQLKPAWEQAAKALKGIVNVAAVDCDEHKSVAGEHGIRGFPTIKFFYVSNGAVKSSDYNGGRSAKEIVAFAMEKAKAYAFKQLGEKPPSGGGSSGGRASGGGAGAGGEGGFYDGTDVVTLTDGNFEDEVMQSDDIWFVEVRLTVGCVAKGCSSCRTTVTFSMSSERPIVQRSCACWVAQRAPFDCGRK